MAIMHPFFGDTAFDPEVTHIMGQAFDKACQSLQELARPNIVKEALAKRILELAKNGERDPDRLCQQALKALNL
jgi:hypothetical protein